MGGELFCFGVSEVAYGQLHSVLRRFEQGFISFQLVQWRTAAFPWVEGLMGVKNVRGGRRLRVAKGCQGEGVIKCWHTLVYTRIPYLASTRD